MTLWFPYRSRRPHKDSSGVNESWIVRCEAIGKGNHQDHPYLIANEFVSARIAQYLGLPVPPFSILRKKTRKTAMFASYSYESESSPRDVRPDVCVNRLPSLCAGILAFDVLIGNCDRHRGNLKVDSPANPTRLYLIDHDLALFHRDPENGVTRLKSIEGRLGISGGSISGGNRHVFLDQKMRSSSLKDWCTRIEKIPDWFIQESCEFARGLGPKRSELSHLEKFLLERRRSIATIIINNQSELDNITDWELFL